MILFLDIFWIRAKIITDKVNDGSPPNHLILIFESLYAFSKGKCNFIAMLSHYLYSIPIYQVRASQMIQNA